MLLLLPACIAVSTEPNRHVDNVTDSLFVVRYPGLLVTSLGDPTERAAASITYDCNLGADQPITFHLQAGRVSWLRSTTRSTDGRVRLLRTIRNAVPGRPRKSAPTRPAVPFFPTPAHPCDA